MIRRPLIPAIRTGEYLRNQIHHVLSLKRIKTSGKNLRQNQKKKKRKK
jgi:hypothetical protein